MTRAAPSQERVIIDFLRQALPDVKLIYLFGSHANGSATANSDFDMAILPSAPLDNVQRFNLAQELAIQLDRDVDLVDLLNASTVMQMQVVTTGKLLFGDPDVDVVFSAQIYSMYGRLQEDRKDIIQSFIQGE
ncbi:type VII toxin-antitoxin system MntA family adenylyltransferase antitoxin [Motilimonas eburnea]|uniref:type VII toxin-antitoxin system MntA family adenylyltransferase antitoxin n=1 Tax=Motilimonas eburnea TaxID=1737488 RepID=UPI001E53F20A|nr:nucleotidyltransferase domain-containing protein [Motilimonas eburnea]MCE2572678.1 nucleotidyltransferase domain-containing protein [Motilimonas eburnea]